jgi:hypothetical protein
MYKDNNYAGYALGAIALALLEAALTVGREAGKRLFS